MSIAPESACLLRVRELTVAFPSAASEGRTAPAVDGVSFCVRAGEAVGLVGESGSGKSATALAIMGLVPPPGQVGGAVCFEGRELLQLPERELRAVRGRRLAMVFQEPMTSLNPVLTIGEQIAEMLRLHRRLGRREACARAVEALRTVQLPAPEQRLRGYPHQLSGGMRQRVMIAMALCCEPALLIADEPTTALDVTIQAQLLELLAALQRRLGLAVLLISHDLGVVARLCQRVVVMYGGQVMEQGATRQVLSAPRHPYTAALLRARPDPARPRARLEELPGAFTDSRGATGCRFGPRCVRATASCSEQAPPWSEVAAEEGVRCCDPLEPDAQGADASARPAPGQP